jgi:hypothetical protein
MPFADDPMPFADDLRLSAREAHRYACLVALKIVSKKERGYTVRMHIQPYSVSGYSHSHTHAHVHAQARDSIPRMSIYDMRCYASSLPATNAALTGIWHPLLPGSPKQ